MGMHEGRASLRKSVKELMMHWAETRTHWQDVNAHAFEDKFIIPLGQNAKKALSGMDQMAQVLSRIRQDCEDND